MPRRFFLAPAGFISPLLAGEEPFSSQRAQRLAGCGLGFTGLNVIERTEEAPQERFVSLTGPDGFYSPLWQERQESGVLREDFARLIAPRPALAGLSLDQPRIMGIVNVTPDSFSDGGSFTAASAAIEHGLRLAEEGADILDIGGESTRPGADPVPLDEELRRVMPVLEGLRARTTVPLSIDTRKAEVMRRAAAAGAALLNDVSALTHDPEALVTAADTGLPIVLMHAQGDPKTMNIAPKYRDVRLDVFEFLEARILACEDAGISRGRLIADPGIGFGKHLSHNVAVLASLALYHSLGVPVLLGASRKKLIGQLCNVEDPKARLPGSLAAVLAGLAQGVQIVRVHDVAATRQAIAVWQAIAQAPGNDPA